MAIASLVAGVEDLFATDRLRHFNLSRLSPLSSWMVRSRDTAAVTLAVVILVDDRLANLGVLGALFILQVVRIVQLRPASDAADAMLAWVIFVLFVHRLVEPDGVTGMWWSVTALAMAAIAYLSSGVAKMRVAEWRSGQMLVRVLSSTEYGFAYAPWGRQLPGTPLAVSAWLVISAEISYPAMIAAGGIMLIIASVVLAFMHLVIAMTMRLGKFFWTFCTLLLLVVAARLR
jgi:hypothetical protein